MPARGGPCGFFAMLMDRLEAPRAAALVFWARLRRTGGDGVVGAEEAARAERVKRGLFLELGIERVM